MRSILVLCLIGLANAFPQGYQYPQPEGSQTDAAILNRFVSDPAFSTMFLSAVGKKTEETTAQNTDIQMAVLTVKQSEMSNEGSSLSTRVDTMLDMEEVKDMEESSTTSAPVKGQSEMSDEESVLTTRLNTDSKEGYKYPTPNEEDGVNTRFSEASADKKEVVTSTDKAEDTTSEAPVDEDEMTESVPTLDPSKLGKDTEEAMKQLVLFPPKGEERTDFAIGTSSRSGVEFIPDVGKLPLSPTAATSMLKVNRTIVKHFYIHEAPEFDDEEESVPEQSTAAPTTHYNIVFVKAPSDSAKSIARTLAKTQNEQKTIIYVLVKKTGTEEIHHALKLSPPPTNKPQVYFIRYKTPEEAENALNNIKNEYNLLGGETMYFNEGRAPVQSFIGKVNKPSNNQGAFRPSQSVSSLSGSNSFSTGSFGPDPFGLDSLGPDPLGPGSQGTRPQGPRPQGPRPQGPRPQGSGSQGPRPQGSGSQGPRPQGPRPQGPGQQGFRPQGQRPQGQRPQGPDTFNFDPFGPGFSSPSSFNSRFSGQGFAGSRPSGSSNQFRLSPMGPSRQSPSPPRKSHRYLPPPIPQF